MLSKTILVKQLDLFFNKLKALNQKERSQATIKYLKTESEIVLRA